jgi:Kdo2-lipid IVA lauroyltransferase/acyltransferase|tara:strand:- start:6398 stop:7273 length:876 start_codon:yes stop_codon:yes gene_type:complete
MHLIKIIKYLIESCFIYIFFIIIKIFRLKKSRKVFSYVFNKVGPLIKSKNTINENLDKIIPNLDEKKKEIIINDMWSNYGMTFVEYMFLNNFRMQHDHIQIKGKNILESIKNKNKPVIFISGHFANFELMSMELSKNHLSLATIYRPLNNIFLNPFMEYLRKKYICKNQIKKGLPGIRHSIEYLKKDHSIALMVDQRLSEGKNLPFFNFNALTTTLPAQLALRFKIDIVPIYLSRLENNSFSMEVLDPIKTNELQNNEKNKIDITIELNKIIEKMILRDPSQWILSHNRWK